jgi:hypothetical protein
MLIELSWFMVGMYAVVKFFQYLDTQSKYPNPLDTLQDYI